MKFLCLICARGGSKGIKNKNLLKIGKKTLLHHSIDIAKKTNMFSKIVVSTDSKKIADHAKINGAEVPFLRPKKLSRDNSAEIGAWKHAINFFKNKNIEFDGLVSLPCTSPLRNLNDVIRCVKKFKTKKFDSVISVKKSTRNPYFNMIEKKRYNNYDIVIRGKKYIHNRQMAPITYDVSTVCFVSKIKYILKHKNLFEGKVGIVEIPLNRSIDIDNQIDYKLAKIIYEKKI
tara:strand:+ start:613 stop:1305 length:693 start_codon:yes stop_codon:yes gene_type:complete